MPAATTTRLLNDGWTFREVDAEVIPNSDTTRWLSAVVPGHVHLDLLRLGVIPDPFRRMHERAVQWIDERDWEYRCTFAVGADELDGARHLLRFEGLDTIATVVLNQEVIGQVDNMFVTHDLDVTDVLRSGENSLEVRFASAQRVGEERRAAALAERDDAAQVERGLMPRSTVRKAQYMYGWDWGPRLRSCGIWRDVSLVRVPIGRIEAWSWSATFADDGTCAVAVAVDADGQADGLRMSLAGHTARAAVGDHAVVVIDDPQRWWPAGYGEQALYDLHVELLAHDDVVDSIQTRIGLQQLELVREPDDAGESFYFRINGVPVFAKGANWIPDDSFPSRTSVERVRAQLQLARDCGMNMLRVWGGGLYESEDFYAICDELGLLVWQDFPYACALYPEADEFVGAAVAEARAAIRRVRTHTSLAVWCGNNESQWLAGMGAFGPDAPVLGRRLYDDALPAVVVEEDPGRPYWPGSPFGAGPDPNGEGDGDCHYWNVWHGEGDWTHYTKCSARFVSEFGFAAAPDIRTLQECLDPPDLAVDTPAMRWHDKTRKGYETYLGYIALHYPMPSTLPDLVYYSQLNQADAMRFGIEHFRRLRPRTMGTLAWQLNDCWPVQSWAWIDHQLRPKAAWYAAKRFYAPLLVSLHRDGDRLTTHLVNDLLERRDGTLAVRAIDGDGSVLWTTTIETGVDGGSSVQVVDIALPPQVLDAARHAVVHATFAEGESTLLLCEPRDLRLTAPRLDIRGTPEADGARLRLESETLALSVMLSLGGRDATWSDNFFHLLPGERREVLVTPREPVSFPEITAALRWRALP